MFKELILIVWIILVIISLIYTKSEFFEPNYNYAANMCLFKTHNNECNTIVGINERPQDKYIPKNFSFF